MSEPELNAHIAEKVAEKVEEVAEVTRQQNHSIKKSVWLSSIVTQVPAWFALIGIVWKVFLIGATATARVETLNGLPERMTIVENLVRPLPGRIGAIEVSVSAAAKVQKQRHDDAMAAIFRIGDHTHDVAHILHKKTVRE